MALDGVKAPAVRSEPTSTVPVIFPTAVTEMAVTVIPKVPVTPELSAAVAVRSEERRVGKECRL